VKANLVARKMTKVEWGSVVRGKMLSGTQLKAFFSRKDLGSFGFAAGVSEIKISSFDFREAILRIKVGDSVSHPLLELAFGGWLRSLQGKRPMRMQGIDQGKEAEYRDQILCPITMWSTSRWDDVFGYALIMYGRRFQ
jgi:hypothetical protein